MIPAIAYPRRQVPSLARCERVGLALLGVDNSMTATIRDLISRHGGLPVPVDTLRDEDDLYEAGLSSFASVQLMLGLEEAFDIEFPETLLNRKTFASIAAISAAIASLTAGQVA